MQSGKTASKSNSDTAFPNPNAIGFRVRELRALGGPGKTTAFALIRLGKLKIVKVGRITIVDGDSFRALMRGKT